MPYNNAPIEPTQEVTGTSALPLARVKKIIAQDDEIAQCSNNAAFAISVATEIFVRYLTEQAHVVVKSERKPRRNIAYKDIATAISRIDNLEFLSDVVPRTKTYRQIKEDKAREDEAVAGHIAPPTSNGVNGTMSAPPIEYMMRQNELRQQTDGQAEPRRVMIAHREHQANEPTQIQRVLNGQPLVQPNSNPPAQPGDVEMSG